jgi:hypothetical protein
MTRDPQPVASCGLGGLGRYARHLACLLADLVGVPVMSQYDKWVSEEKLSDYNLGGNLPARPMVRSTMKKYIYLIGRLKDERVPWVAYDLRAAGFDVFDDWYSAGPTADDDWQQYEKARGRSYVEALDCIAARHAFKLDFDHLHLADAGVLVLPAGKSAHMELGYLAGKGKATFILLPGEEPERWDLMYKLATYVCTSVPELVEKLKLL